MTPSRNIRSHSTLLPFLIHNDESVKQSLTTGLGGTLLGYTIGLCDPQAFEPNRRGHHHGARYPRWNGILKHLNVEYFNEHREFEVNDDFDDGTPKERDNNSGESTQHSADERTDTGQQLAKQSNNFEQDGKNFVFVIKGNAAVDALDELDDDLVDRLDQLGPLRTRENGDRPRSQRR